MKDVNRLLWLLAGMLLGGLIYGLYLGNVRPAYAANDRHEDYVMCTGVVYSTRPGRGRAQSPLEGVWLLDYRSGKLLGTLIDRYEGKLYGWSEVDLVAEFGIPPRKPDVHFLMTTGSVTYNQAALYVAETSTGKFAVYTMGPRGDNIPGVTIRRHDMTTFRK